MSQNDEENERAKLVKVSFRTRFREWKRKNQKVIEKESENKGKGKRKEQNRRKRERKCLEQFFFLGDNVLLSCLSKETSSGSFPFQTSHLASVYAIYFLSFYIWKGNQRNNSEVAGVKTVSESHSPSNGSYGREPRKQTFTVSIRETYLPVPSWLASPGSKVQSVARGLPPFP